MPPALSFKILTLGCKLNYAESAAMRDALLAMGLRDAGTDARSDVCIINSCSVTRAADKKSRQALHKALAQSGFAAFTGCSAALNANGAPSLPNGVCIVPRKQDVPAAIAKHFALACAPAASGCDYRCSYCAVPEARGASRSPRIADIAAQAQTIAQAGAREIVLTGINIGDFGRHTGETLLQLLMALNEVPAIERYRLSSIEPNLLTRDIIDFVAGAPKFMPHFHIPLQAGSSRILRLMGRRYSVEFFVKKIEYVLGRMPRAFVGIDVIAGFPTETDAEFAQSAALLQGLGAAYLHVFPYSARPRTPAAALPQTPPHVIAERARTLGILCRRLHTDFCLKHIGGTGVVLFENACKNGAMAGFTENYIRVEIPCDARLAGRTARTELCALLPNGSVSGRIAAE